MTRTLPPGDPLGPEGTVMSGPEGQAGVTAAFREDEARDRAGKWTGHGGGGQPDAHDMVSRSVAAFRSGTDYPPAPARPAGLRMGPVKQCYSNAAQAAIDHRLPYAEGYALSGRIGYWVHHAWNVDPEGRAVDLTWKEPGDRYVGRTYATMDVLDKAVERGNYDAMAPDLITLLPPDMAEGTAAASADLSAGLAAAYADPAVTALVSVPVTFADGDVEDPQGRAPGG